MDVVEIDAASNNSVDDIRELREKVALAPERASQCSARATPRHEGSHALDRGVRGGKNPAMEEALA